MKIKTYTDFLTESINVNQFEEFIGLVFQSRDIMHIKHLSTDKYTIHTTLNGYYIAIIDLIDLFVEQYQGAYGKIGIKIPASDSSHDINNTLTNLNSNLIALKKTLTENDGSLAATLDSIQELINTTLYKLKELN